MNIIEWLTDKFTVGRKLGKIKKDPIYKQNSKQIDLTNSEMAMIRDKLEKSPGMAIEEKREMWKEYNKHTNNLLKLQETNIHRQMEEQLIMKKQSDTLVFYFQEAVVQMGYITFFGCCFTLAPLFSVITNLIEVKIKIN